MLLKHGVMPEAEAMRFLHGVVSTVVLASMLKLKFPKDAHTLMEEVCICVCARGQACVSVKTSDVCVCAPVCLSLDQQHLA